MIFPFTIPVLVIFYFPLSGDRIDRTVTGDVDAPLEKIRTHAHDTTWRVLHALETGSAYRRYNDPPARPSLRYSLIGAIEIKEPMPTYVKAGHNVPMCDYNAILERANIAEWVEERGVKEVWIWGYHGGVIDIWESNMAGPFGDISNSDRDPHDLPLLSRTYTVYHYNYQRGPSEAIENHIHQIEAVLRHIDHDLFWNRFVGKPGEGRCGWAHYPPNGERDYDWCNPNEVWTDIEDWQPDGGGIRKLMNCERWNSDSLTWFVYWMQSLPGAGNQLTHQGRALTNWWSFLGDFDRAMANRMGLTR